MTGSLRNHLRAGVRLLLILIITISLGFLLLTGYLLLFIFGVSRDHFRNSIISKWSFLVCRTLNLTISVKGPKPEAPFFLVSNHLGYLDILLYFRILPVTFVSREDVKRWPLIGRLSRLTDIIFIDRKRKREITAVNQQIATIYHRPFGLLLFPEGTTSDGTQILPVRSSLLEYPANAGLPVHISVITYKTGKGDPPAETSVCWYDETSFTEHAYQLLKLKQITARILFSHATVQGHDRKELSEKITSIMNNLHSLNISLTNSLKSTTEAT